MTVRCWEARIGHDALDAGCLVGDPAAGRELAGRERGGHGDEPDLRPAPPARLAPSKSISPATRVMSRRLSSEAAATLQASIGLPPTPLRPAHRRRPTRISATSARTEFAGTCCPTPANTPAQCGPSPP